MIVLYLVEGKMFFWFGVLYLVFDVTGREKCPNYRSQNTKHELLSLTIAFNISFVAVKIQQI